MLPLALKQLGSNNYTRISNGMFMDSWLGSHIPSSFKHHMQLWMDVDNNCASIPGDDN